MNPLVLTKSARERISELLRESNTASPVARLGRQSAPVQLPPELIKSAVDGGNEEGLLAFAREKATSAQFALRVFALDKSECRAEDLHVVDGITLCMPVFLFGLFAGHMLDLRGNQFVVTRADGSEADPTIQQLVGG